MVVIQERRFGFSFSTSVHIDNLPCCSYIFLHGTTKTTVWDVDVSLCNNRTLTINLISEESVRLAQDLDLVVPFELDESTTINMPKL